MNQPFSLHELQDLPRVTQKPSYVKAIDGINLAYYSFMPESISPSALVILYHGGGLYGNNAYQWIGSALRAYAIGTYVVDIRGHGNSEGLARGDAPSVEHVWRDIDTLLKLVADKHPGVPVYLVGHSSGAGLLVNYNAWKKEVHVHGYIFLAPYFGPLSETLQQHTDPQRNFVKKVKTWIFILNAITSKSLFTHIPAVFFNHPNNLVCSDPLVVPYYTYTMSCAVTPYRARELFAQLSRPFALYIGDKDEQFVLEKVIAFKECATKVRDCSMAEIVPDAQHLSILLNSPQLIAKAIDQIKIL